MTFNEVTTIAAGEGVLLKGAEGDYDIPTTTGVAKNNDNKLIGVLNETTIDQAGIFVLMDGTKGVGFYKTTTAFTVGANTAYLPATSSSRDFIGFGEDNTTGISNLNVNDILNYYNLQGQRVNKAQKGLYIMNGKKVIK